MIPSATDDATERTLVAAIERLRDMAPVERIILFGSRARGDHTEDSDWDLCVLLPDAIPAGRYTPSSMWSAVRHLGLPIQVMPMRTSVFERKRHDVNALAHDVASEGIVLFERPRKHVTDASHPGDWIRKARQDARSARRLLMLRRNSKIRRTTFTKPSRKRSRPS